MSRGMSGAGVCRMLRALALAMPVVAATGAGSPAWGQDSPAGEPTPSPREQELRKQLRDILHELEELQHKKEQATPEAERPPIVKETTPELSEAAAEPVPSFELADMSIVSRRFQQRLEGMSLLSTVPAETDSQPTRTMQESLQSMPGIALRQANGPRDFSIMIRGQGAKTTFAVRDIKIYEDGFIQTQSDGLSRLDLQDPWFMRSTEVIRGAASSLYDNYALGGMVQFRTRRGSDINGFETFLSGGSFGYFKQAFALGQHTDRLDVALFASNVAEDGFIRNSNYNTQTLDFNFRFNIDDKQSVYFKAISNWLDTRVPTRLTQAQFIADERQAGGAQTVCVAGAYNPGCADAIALHQGRVDRRTIIGGMYERQLDASTSLTIEADYDVKDINQYFSQITDNVNPNYKTYTDLRHTGHLGAMPLKSYVGFFANNMEQEGQTFQNLATGFGTRGTLLQNNRGRINNIGGRIREELEIDPQWLFAAGLGFEQSQLSIDTINYDNTGAVASRPSITRDFTNWAPEASLTWKPTESHRYWVRSSTGYAIPTFANLTRDPVTGLPGANFDLKPQKNWNNEIGMESRITKDFMVQLVGFWTFFKDEIITQTISGANTISANADSSQYRGIEAFYDWRPLEGLRLSGAYTHIQAKYINFSDRTAAGSTVRDGKQVPNVPTDFLNLKMEYDHSPTGWGGWLEANYYNSYFLNNNNTFAIPSYFVGTANIHKTMEVKNRWFRFARFYLQVDNIADKKYAASGQVVTGETTAQAAGQQAFFAGYGRAIYGGVTIGLF
ncbi:MAG TPA: TonB-dependent receptor [Nitrospira sp.]|nr:TonB-dependent receptor [Nitrospira sp.]